MMHKRSERKGSALLRGYPVVPVGLSALGAAAVLTLGWWAWPSSVDGNRQPGTPPEIPPYQVRPAPTLDRPEVDRRMPEEETLPQRLRKRQALDPEKLARDHTSPETTSREVLIPPLDAPPDPEAGGAGARSHASSASPVRLARVSAAGGGWQPGFAAAATPPGADAGDPVQVAVGTTPEPEPEPRRTSSPDPLDDLILAPAGSEPIQSLDPGPPLGTPGKGPWSPLPVPKDVGPKGDVPQPLLIGDDPPVSPRDVIDVPADPPPSLGPPAIPAGPPEVQGQDLPGTSGKPSLGPPGLPIAASRSHIPDHAPARYVVPEPATAPLLALGLLWLARRRHH